MSVSLYAVGGQTLEWPHPTLHGEWSDERDGHRLVRVGPASPINER